MFPAGDGILLAGDVVREGYKAGRSRKTFSDCPYEIAGWHDLFAEGFHGTKPIGRVRIGVDYHAFWHAGRELGERSLKVD
jgi:hypothetical protein